jgi:hypothetical protein
MEHNSVYSMPVQWCWPKHSQRDQWEQRYHQVLNQPVRQQQDCPQMLYLKVEFAGL